MLTSEKMAFQMFKVEVRLIAVRTLVLALGILVRVREGLADSGRRPTGMRGKHTAPSLLAHDVHRLWFLVREHGSMGIELRMGQPQAAGAYILQSGRQRRRRDGVCTRVGCSRREKWWLRVR